MLFYFRRLFRDFARTLCVAHSVVNTLCQTVRWRARACVACPPAWRTDLLVHLRGGPATCVVELLDGPPAR